MALDFPDTPQDGDTFGEFTYDATRQAWRTVRSGARIVASATAPTSPINGDMWLYTEDGAVFTYLDGAWIEVGNSTAVLSDADNARITSVEDFKDLFEIYDPADGDVLSYNSTSGLLENTQLNITSSLAELTDTAISSPSAGDSLIYNGASWVNGPSSNNAIINGDFGIWQRGTSFTVVSPAYTADRFDVLRGGATNAEVSRQSFNVADIETIGYGDAEYFLRTRSNGSISGTFSIGQKIEDVRVFSGQQVTLSFWGKASSEITVSSGLRQNFGSGGSSTVNYLDDITFSTSWQRFTRTIDLNSLVGKTVGASSYLKVDMVTAFNVGTAIDGIDFDIWGVQLEAGSVATPFRLAGGGSKAAELALCQRYYEIVNLFFAYISYKGGQGIFKVDKRATPTVTFYTGNDAGGTAGQLSEANASGAGHTITFSVITTRAVLSMAASSYSGTTNFAGSLTASAEL